jgi:tetratricopeptide (TPR) repeat protein
MLQRSQPGLAIIQLRLVTDLQPDDVKAHELLIQAYDQLNQPDQAMEEAYALAESARRNSEYWKQLGDRYAKQKQSAESERAYTSMIELLPSEAEGQSKLADVRQQQNRWAEAITHWKLAVDYKTEDPAGLLGLAQAQLHQKQWNDAAITMKKLRQPAQPWHRRFGDVAAKVEHLQQEMQREKK